MVATLQKTARGAYILNYEMSYFSHYGEVTRRYHVGYRGIAYPHRNQIYRFLKFHSRKFSKNFRNIHPPVYTFYHDVPIFFVILQKL